MRNFDNIKRSRLKLTIYFGSLVALITGYCAYIEMAEATTIGLGIIGGIIAKYSHDETKRPSN